MSSSGGPWAKKTECNRMLIFSYESLLIVITSASSYKMAITQFINDEHTSYGLFLCDAKRVVFCQVVLTNKTDNILTQLSFQLQCSRGM